MKSLQMVRLALFTIPAFLLPAIMDAQVPIDNFINMDNVSPQPPGTQLTTSILANGSMGSLSGWSLTGTASSMTVGNHQVGCNLGTSVTVSGTTYTPAAPSQSFASNNASNFSYWTANTPSGHSKISIAWCGTFGAIPAATNLMDMVRVDATSGLAAVAQLRPGSGPGCFNIETNAGGVVHSPCITLSNGGTYWCSLFVDTGAGNSQLACYQPTAPFTQVGSTISRSFTPGIGNILRVLVGNAETGTAAGTTNYFENMIFAFDANAVFPLGIGTGVGTQNTPWTGILAPGRAMVWSQAGVVGGVPNRTTICQTLNPGATSAQINSAIASCPPNEVVFLNAGTYSGLGGINFTGTNNVTLRGAGADQTSLVFSSVTGCNEANGTLVCIGGTDNNWKGAPSNTAIWAAGYSAGTTQITLSSVTNLKVGNLVILDQLDDDQTGCDVGGIFVSQSTTTCVGAISPGLSGPFSLQGNGGGSQRSGRQQEEIHLVAGCNGSTTPGFACSGTNVLVTLAEGLVMPNWRSGQTPQAWWPTTPITGDGIENLSIDGTGVANGTGVQFKNASNSWVKGVRIIDTNRAHVQRDLVTHITERDSYQFLTQNSATQSYGDECFGDSFGLVENNIFHAVAGPVVINSACLGMVISYNFAINDFYTPSPGWNETGSSVHTSGVAYVLYEGNSWNEVESDVFHGTHHFITQFRNREAETQPACYSSGSSYATSSYGACNNNLSMRTMAFSRFYNFVGNVLGTTGVQVGYQTGNPAIWSIGNGNSANGVSVPADPNVATTMLRWGNYDTFNAAATFSTAEVPSALTGVQALFSNPVPASQGLPASFYLNAKPSWWAAAKPWPAIGPDVTGGNVPGVGGHVYTIPAQDCYLNIMGGLANGTGPVLNFNASACYSSSSATLPAPPTGLQGVVH